MAYTVVTYEAEEGGYWARVPELPGCASQGETLDELQNNIRDAISAWLDATDHDQSDSASRFFGIFTVERDNDLVPA